MIVSWQRHTNVREMLPHLCPTSFLAFCTKNPVSAASPGNTRTCRGERLAVSKPMSLITSVRSVCFFLSLLNLLKIGWRKLPLNSSSEHLFKSAVWVHPFRLCLHEPAASDTWITNARVWRVLSNSEQTAWLFGYFKLNCHYEVYYCAHLKSIWYFAGLCELCVEMKNSPLCAPTSLIHACLRDRVLICEYLWSESGRD